MTNSIQKESWYVLKTRPRVEKKLANQLEVAGITVYCPMKVGFRQWSDRTKKVSAPLINSTIFVKILETRRDRVFEFPGATRYLFWLGKPALVRDTEIEVMQAWLSKKHLDVTISDLQPGDRVQIPKGPFKGKEGMVTESRKHQVQLILESMGIKITIAT